MSLAGLSELTTRPNPDLVKINNLMKSLSKMIGKHYRILVYRKPGIIK